MPAAFFSTLDLGDTRPAHTGRLNDATGVPPPLTQLRRYPPCHVRKGLFVLVLALGVFPSRASPPWAELLVLLPSRVLVVVLRDTWSRLNAHLRHREIFQC